MSEFLIWLLLAQAADIGTTAVALNRGCVEANPGLARASLPVMTGIKAGVSISLTIHFGRKPAPTKTDKTVVGMFAGAATGAAVWNLRQIPRCR